MTTSTSSAAERTPDYLRRAAIVRRSMAAIVAVVVLAAVVHPLLQKTPKMLDVSTLPVTSVSLGHRLVLENPLDPSIASATVTAITLSRTTATVRLSVCPKGTWSPNGVAGFALILKHHEALLPEQASPLLSVAAHTCTASSLVFSVPRDVEIRGVAYVQVPYVNAAWMLARPLQVARNS